jgi:hypothetical protein
MKHISRCSDFERLSTVVVKLVPAIFSFTIMSLIFIRPGYDLRPFLAYQDFAKRFAALTLPLDGRRQPLSLNVDFPPMLNFLISITELRRDPFSPNVLDLFPMEPSRPEDVSYALVSAHDERNALEPCVYRGLLSETYAVVDYQCVRENRVSVNGIYSDGWAGDSIRVTFNAATTKRLFELKGFIPNWHPSNEVEINIESGLSKTTKYILRKDADLYIKELLPKKQGSLTISISGGFVPSSYPNSTDERMLTFVVKEASIMEGDIKRKIYEFKE